MLKRVLVAGSIFIAGYLAGLLFGYRAAVVDYVENDAKTIESMADTMYEKASFEDLPDEVQQAIKQSEGEDGEEAEADGKRGFQ